MMPHAVSHHASDIIRNDSGSNIYLFKKEMIDDTQNGCLSKFKSAVDNTNSSNVFVPISSQQGLLDQLKATKIKESILLEGIQRLGGGQKGLRRLVRTILVWVHARSQAQSGERSTSHSELSSPALDEFPWSNLDSASVVDGSQGQCGQQQHQTLSHVHLNNRHSSSFPPLDLSCMMNSNSSGRDSEVNGSLCGLRSGDRGSEVISRDFCGQVQPNFESQPPVSSFIGLQPEGSSPGAAGVHNDVLSGDWVPTYMQKSHGNRMIRKLSPSSDSSGIHSATHDFISFDETVTEQQGKTRRHSPTSAGFSSSSENSTVTNEFPTYMTSSTSVSEVLGTAGIFGVPGANPFAPGGPFSISPSSPPSIDTHSLDFNAFSTQASILVHENLGLGSGCSAIDRFGSLERPLCPEHSLDRKPTSARLGVVSKSKTTLMRRRLARKQRMDRNRKAALYQVNRVAFETNGPISGESDGTCSPVFLRNTSRSQPATDFRTIDRRDEENLQFLLMKVLRPSDVGNLGRIIIPKKDAESHLPWLGAKEGIGIQFICEDYDTREIMTLRYRFWPNNKSRMYLLENTGDFVKKHHLEKSDRMLIYRSQPQGIYIIRARKAHDCEDSLHNLQREDMSEDTKEITGENSPGGPCSSGASSLSGAESQGPGHDGAPESGVFLSVITTSQDDLQNFADLPDAPVGEGLENLVQFPSLESFDDLLQLAFVNKEETTSGVGKMKEECEP